VLEAAEQMKSLFEAATLKSLGTSEIPDVPDYISLPLPRESIFKQYQESQPNVAYPNLNPSLYGTSFERKRIDYIYNPEKYIPLLKKAGYKVKVIPGDAVSYANELPVRTKTLYLFQPYKNFDDCPGTPEKMSGSMQFVVNVLTSYVNVKEVGGNTSNPLIPSIIQMIGNLYGHRCINAFVPLPPARSFPDQIGEDFEIKHTVCRNIDAGEK
jgi:hypothetical protein